MESNSFREIDEPGKHLLKKAVLLATIYVKYELGTGQCRSHWVTPRDIRMTNGGPEYVVPPSRLPERFCRNLSGCQAHARARCLLIWLLHW